MSIDLFAHRRNEHSQNGEDGILEKILAELGIQRGFFVEFGAWDGKHWSNTYRLVGQQWRGCLIEGDPAKFAELGRNVPGDEVIKVQAWIAPTGPMSLDEILRRHGVEHVDLLSIDIDSDDLAIWESLSAYTPTIVIIEFNTTIPFDTRYRNPPGTVHGNSALSILEVAHSRDYALVAGTDTNLIFIRRDALAATAIPERTLQDVRDNTFQLRYFFAFDGRMLHTYDFINKSGVTELFPVPWAFTVAPQPVPRMLRRRSDKISPAILLFSGLAALVRCPIQMLKLVAYVAGTVRAGRSMGEMLAMLVRKDKLTDWLKSRAASRV
ncbi:MAG TPA: hypothetical protein VE650_15115 [Acetobacteraceae bacterium]|nr:hypothetical protein [Acetobacteraceae bacterium]